MANSNRDILCKTYNDLMDCHMNVHGGKDKYKSTITKYQKLFNKAHNSGCIKRSSRRIPKCIRLEKKYKPIHKLFVNSTKKCRKVQNQHIDYTSKLMKNPKEHNKFIDAKCSSKYD